MIEFWGGKVVVSHRKKCGLTFRYTGWLIGILIMVYEIISTEVGSIIPYIP